MDYYKDYQELFDKAVLWWTGYDQTNLGFPIIPSGVTVTPNGTWTNNFNLGNNKSAKTFSGSQYITLTNLTQLAFADVGMTICFWIRPTDTSVRYMFSKMVTWASNVDFHIAFQASPSRIIYMNYINTQNSLTYELPVNSWSFVVVVREIGGVFKTYVNGEFARTWVYGTAMYNNSSTLYIGRSASGTKNMYVGQLKDALFYVGRVLTQPEIKLLMRLTEPGKRDITPVLSGVRGCE